MVEQMQLSSPRVSVVIPAYNNSATLARALESLAAQDHPNYHVVAIDDCSPDNSFEIAQSVAVKYPHLKALQNAKNLGAVANFASAYQYVEGELFMIGGPGDSWAPNYISRMTALLEEHPATICALSSVNSLYDDNGESEIYRWPELKYASDRQHPAVLPYILTALHDRLVAAGMAPDTCF